MNRFALFKIRVIQIKRQLQSLGIIYALLVFSCTTFLIYFTYEGFSQPSNALKVSSVIFVPVLAIHFSRKDLIFARRHIEHPVQNIFFENVLLSLPFTITCLFTRQWFWFPILCFAFFLISLFNINFKIKTQLPWLSNIIPPSNFEWLSGVRKYSIYFFLFAILAASTCLIKIVPLFFLWLFTAVVSSFYYECEPLQVLYASAKNPHQLLGLKAKKHSMMMLYLFLPVLIINSIIHPDAILINVVFLIVQLTFLIFAIFIKYSLYSPNEDLKQNSVLLSIAFLGSIIPFLLPVQFIMCIRNYKKAIKTLNIYFND